MFAIAALEPLLIRGLLILGVVIALWGAWHQLTGHYVDVGRAEVQAKWDADKAARIKAFADMTTKWVVASQAAEKAQEVADDARHQLEVQAQARVRALPPAVARIRVPAVAIRVPNDALDGQPAVARSAAEPAADSAPSAADSDVGLVVGWVVGTVIPQYNACRDEVRGWQAFYSSLRATQSEVTP